ncbi:PAS domain-containing protein [Nonomuraea aridisoli]|nr:PAS domain-containing protein [Nonomuraea aridisoli]
MRSSREGADVHELTMGDQELFFSTTDPRGVIREGNSVFVRVSGFELEELVGAPHNTVRHPDMPGGLFRLVWDGLQTGRPMGAYMKNRTKDGRSYWVFATMSPLRDGHVSVRMAPRGPLFDFAQRVYAQAAHAERTAIQTNGMNRRDAALLGKAHIEDSLRQGGFSSYEEFMLHALPEEVSVRRRSVAASYARPGARGSIAEILAGTGALDLVLEEFVGHLTAYQRFGDELATISSGVLGIARRLNTSVLAAQRASELVEDSAPVLANVARVMAEPMGESVETLERLQAEFGRLRADLTRLRFQISLAGLYNTMAAEFAAEVFDGAAPPDALAAVPSLCDAAEAGIVEMSAQVQRVNAALDDGADLVAEAGARLEKFRLFLGQWRNLVLRHQAGHVLGDRVRPIDEELFTGWESVELLRRVGRRCESAVVPFDPAALRRHLDRIRVAPASR